MLATHVYLRHDIDAAVRTVHSNLRSLLTKPELTSMIMTKNGVMIHTLLQSCFDVRYSDVLEQIIHEHISAGTGTELRHVVLCLRNFALP